MSIIDLETHNINNLYNNFDATINRSKLTKVFCRYYHKNNKNKECPNPIEYLLLPYFDISDVKQFHVNDTYTVINDFDIIESERLYRGNRDVENLLYTVLENGKEAMKTEYEIVDILSKHPMLLLKMYEYLLSIENGICLIFSVMYSCRNVRHFDTWLAHINNHRPAMDAVEHGRTMIIYSTSGIPTNVNLRDILISPYIHDNYVENGIPDNNIIGELGNMYCTEAIILFCDYISANNHNTDISALIELPSSKKIREERKKLGNNYDSYLTKYKTIMEDLERILNQNQLLETPTSFLPTLNQLIRAIFQNFITYCDKKSKYNRMSVFKKLKEKLNPNIGIQIQDAWPNQSLQHDRRPYRFCPIL